MCPFIWAPVCGLEGSFGPLESGIWSFEGEVFEVVPEDVPPDEDEDTCDLPEALDTITLSFITGGSADWFCQTSTSYYDGDAAESGGIWHNQESWMQTTVDGPGTLSFYWKVSSQSSYDFLEFYIDGVRQDRISGLMSRQQMSYDIITLGSHTLEWRYVKNGSVSSGSDCGWVDKIEHRPEPPIPPDGCSVEDFETGDFSKFNWTFYGDAEWLVGSDEYHSGSYSAQAGSVDHDESTTLVITLDCTDGDIAFNCKVSSESGWDYLKFYIDGVEKDKWSGEQDWTEVYFPVRAGTKTFKWTYSKDSSISEGDDTAWIDDIVFPIDCDYDPNLIFFDDFEDGIFDPTWEVQQGELAIEETNGEIRFRGTTIRGDWDHGSKFETTTFPDGDFEVGVDFRIPTFSGPGFRLIYLCANPSSGPQVGIFYSAGNFYRIQSFSPSSAFSESTHPLIGDENIEFHRMKLSYDYVAETLKGYIDNNLVGSLQIKISGTIKFWFGPATEAAGVTVDARFDNFFVRFMPTPLTIADSVNEFSGTQGQDNWYYGYYDGDGPVPYSNGDFEEFPHYGPGGNGLPDWYGDMWYLARSQYWTALWNEGGHPNASITSYGRQSAEHWVVRRWASEVTGSIRISGRLVKEGTNAGDGITGYILIDGDVVWSQYIEYNDAAGVDYSFAADVNVGSFVDFAIAPNNSDWADSSRFTAVITQPLPIVN